MLNYREEEKSSQIMADQKLEKPQINAVKPKKVQILLITGMSGAGKTQTVNALEDIGYFCVDNLPPNLFSKFIEGLLLAQNSISQVALVADIRNREFFNQLEDSLNQIKQLVSCQVQVLFLEAADEVLVRRYKETRRKHPLADSQDSIIKSITKEREMLANIRGLADTIVDTSNLSNRQLNEEITKIFSQTDDDIMKISIMSFGYKYGLPIEADLVMDVRFLPNPYYVPELRELTGMDESIKKYVFDFQISLDFVYRYADLMQFLLPNYLKEGKKHLTIAIGCTGGRHRSVAISQSLHEILDSYGYHTSIYHRDISKANKKK